METSRSTTLLWLRTTSVKRASQIKSWLAWLKKVKNFYIDKKMLSHNRLRFLTKFSLHRVPSKSSAKSSRNKKHLQARKANSVLRMTMMELTQLTHTLRVCSFTLLKAIIVWSNPTCSLWFTAQIIAEFPLLEVSTSLSLNTAVAQGLIIGWVPAFTEEGDTPRIQEGITVHSSLF